MKSVLTLLVALALSTLVLVGIWKLLPSESGTPPAGPAQTSSAEEPGQGVAPAGEPELTEEEAADREAQAAAAESGEEAWDTAGSVWLRGTVSTRGPCANSGELVAYAFDRPIELGTLDRVLASEFADGEPAAAARWLLSRRPIGPDLGFELPLPPDAQGAHVIVLGRYLVMESSEHLEVDDLDPTVLRPQCGAVIEGRLELPPGVTLEPGEVELQLSGRLEGALSRQMGYGRRAAASADGLFVIRGVRTGREFVLDADCERLAPARAELDPLAPGETGHARLVLTPGASLAGRVVDGDGRPVAEAEVEASRKSLMAPNLGAREATTDADGRFRLTALATGTVTVHASREGYRESDPERIGLAEGQEHTGVELVLDAGESIAGRVLWGGTPAEGVLVRAEVDPAQRLRMGGLGAVRGTGGEDETDAEGRFRITGLGPSRFDLRAGAQPPESLQAELASAGALGADDPVLEEEWIAFAASVEAGRGDLELVLEAPRGVSGRVIDEAGAPVTEFTLRAVQLVETQLGDFARDQREESFEDDEGRFRLSGMVDGSWNLFAFSEGFSPSGPTALAMPDQQDEALEVRVMRSASVSGTVYTPRGAPVGGATVTLDTGGPFWSDEISGAPTPPSATTAEDGTYTLDALRPGSLSLVASAEDHARAQSEPLELTPGEHVSEVDLTLREGGTVTGVVYGTDRELSSGRMVQAVRMSDMSVHFTRSDAQGEFRIEHLEEGSWQIQALPSEQVLANLAGSGDEGVGDLISEIRTAVAEVEEGGTTHVELGRPPADPIELRGRVVSNAAPFGKAVVSFYSEGEDMLAKMRNTTTDADGTFEVTLDGPGKYVAAVQRFGGDFTQQASVEFQVDIPAVEEHELELVLPTGRISGHLRAPGGRPVADERVTLYPAGPMPSGTLWGGGYSEVRSEEDGSFDLTGLRPGTYSVAVGGMVFGGMFDRSAEHGRVVRDVEVREDEWVQGVDFRLEPAGTALVRVVDGAGKPVAGAAVFVRDEAGHLIEVFSATSTDNQGLCEYGGLAAGRYSFSARKDGFASEETRTIEVGGAEVAEVALTLEEGTILWVRLLDGEGNGIQASISVLDEDGRQVGTMVALDDIFELLGGEGFSMTERRIGPLPPGEYQVIATTADGQQETKPVHLRKRAERRLSIYFRD